jgi:NDP-sugar pyrophosphorylase family protein
VQGRSDLRGDTDHLPGLPQGLPRARRDPRHADQRGGALDAHAITAVILAGGQGTRLRPLTLTRPKPIVPLLNVPFLAYQLDLLRRHGITDVVLSCSYMVDEVRRAMGDGAAWGVRLRYAVETDPLGTGGGVRNAVDLAGGLVVVLNGDVLTDADLSRMLGFHAERRAAATIYLIPVADPTAYGLVELGPAGRVLRFTEKPEPAEVTTNTINAGIYVIERDLLARIPLGRPVSIEREFFPALLADRAPFYGWVPDHYWLDIGSPAKYRQAQLDLMAGKVSTRVGPAGAGGRWIAEDVAAAPTAAVTSPCVIGAGTRLAPGCRVGPEAVLGEACVVGAGAVVEGATLWERVEVAAGAVLRDCIVATGARIGAGAVVGPGAVLGAGAAVADDARVSA